MEDSNPSASAGQSADLDFLNRGVLLMRLGRLLAPLVLSAAALALFLRGSLSAALFVLAAAAGSAGALPIEQLAAARTGISRRTLLALEFRVYFGSNRTNALFLSPFLRALPILLGIAAVGAALGFQTMLQQGTSIVGWTAIPVIVIPAFTFVAARVRRGA